MRRLSEIFARTRFLGGPKDAEQEESRLWMIADHLQEDEEAVAFLALTAGNLLLTNRRLLELQPHLDIQGFWNVLRFEGYQVAREVYLREVVGFALDTEGPSGSLHLQVGEEETVLPVAVSPRAEEPREDLRRFGECLSDLL